MRGEEARFASSSVKFRQSNFVSRISSFHPPSSSILHPLSYLPVPVPLAASDIWTQTLRFWSFHDPAVRTAVAGMLLLAISSGALGCFVVLRRMSLLGDSLGHAVLPGVCLGFLVTWTKSPFWILLGAGLSALAAS